MKKVLLVIAAVTLLGCELPDGTKLEVKVVKETPKEKEVKEEPIPTAPVTCPDETDGKPDSPAPTKEEPPVTCPDSSEVNPPTEKPITPEGPKEEKPVEPVDSSLPPKPLTPIVVRPITPDTLKPPILTRELSTVSEYPAVEWSSTFEVTEVYGGHVDRRITYTISVMATGDAAIRQDYSIDSKEQRTDYSNVRTIAFSTTKMFDTKVVLDLFEKDGTGYSFKGDGEHADVTIKFEVDGHKRKFIFEDGKYKVTLSQLGNTLPITFKVWNK